MRTVTTLFAANLVAGLCGQRALSKDATDKRHEVLVDADARDVKD